MISTRSAAGLAAALSAPALVLAAAPATAAPPPPAHYRVTLLNLADKQPLSPPVLATHRPGIHLFRVGDRASDNLAALAQDGNQQPLVQQLLADTRTTQAVDVGVPLAPLGHDHDAFHDAVTVDVTARAGDRLSLASMVICTNDGFIGLDGVALPAYGSKALLLRAFDAGREDNTWQSEDLPDACSAVGTVPLAGDPNGNRDAEVASAPGPIRWHQGVQDVPGADVTSATHGWVNPVAAVVITRVPD